MRGSPKHNSVVERCNTLMDMVRSMLSYSSLPLSLWIEALNTATYLLNWFPSKAVSKTLFELKTRRRPNLRHLRVWDCKAKVNWI